MCFTSTQRWILILLIVFIKRGNVQIAYPLFMPPSPPVIALPPPIPIPLIAIEIPEITTTTTTEKSVAIAFPVPLPMPMPMPIQVAVPSYTPEYCVSNPKSKTCPPCPPCLCTPQCTPAFFSYCSSCHLKCRCRSTGEAPVPLPAIRLPEYSMSAPAGESVIVLPRQPKKRRRWKPRSSSSSCEDSSDSSDREYYRKGKKFKRRRLKMFRRRGSSEDENDVVRPFLTYVSNDGDIKYEKKITNQDADLLLSRSDTRRYKNIQVMTRPDDDGKHQVVVASEDIGPRRYKQVVLRDGAPSHVLRGGKKELLFKPSGERRISNLSVSFQIS